MLDRESRHDESPEGVAHGDDGPEAELSGQGGHVRGQLPRVVAGCGYRRSAMTAQVHGDDAMAGGHERIDLPDPVVRVTTPPVHEHDRFLAVAVVRVEQLDTADVDKGQTSDLLVHEPQKRYGGGLSKHYTMSRQPFPNSTI